MNVESKQVEHISKHTCVLKRLVYRAHRIQNLLRAENNQLAFPYLFWQFFLKKNKNKKSEKQKQKKKESLSERKAYSLTMRGIQNATGNWTAVLTREFLKSKGNIKRDETVWKE